MILSAAHCFADGVSTIPEIVRLGITRTDQANPQDRKIGHLWGYYNNHPVYQHYSGLDYVYFLTNLWWVGPVVGQKKAGLLNNDSANCPYQVT